MPKSSLHSIGGNPAKVDADVMAVVMGEIRKSIVLK